MHEKRGISRILLIVVGVIILVVIGAAAAASFKPGTSPASSTTNSSTTASNRYGILSVTCSSCTAKISGQSQYEVTIGWNLVYPSSNVDNVSQYQTQANGTTHYLVTTNGPPTSWFVDWNVQDQSASGGNLTVIFTLDNGQVVFDQSTVLFPDIVQGNYSSS